MLLLQTAFKPSSLCRETVGCHGSTMCWLGSNLVKPSNFLSSHKPFGYIWTDIFLTITMSVVPCARRRSIPFLERTYFLFSMSPSFGRLAPLGQSLIYFSHLINHVQSTSRTLRSSGGTITSVAASCIILNQTTFNSLGCIAVCVFAVFPHPHIPLFYTMRGTPRIFTLPCAFWLRVLHVVRVRGVARAPTRGVPVFWLRAVSSVDLRPIRQYLDTSQLTRSSDKIQCLGACFDIRGFHQHHMTISITERR